jgi:precorrin-6B methylase 2
MDIVDRVLSDRPSFHLGGTVRWDTLTDTLRLIEQSVHDGDQTMEIGCGVSTVVFAACGARHTVISPDPGEHERVREYCERSGVDVSQVVFLTGFSDDLLPAMCRERTFDVIFIDGAHSFPYPEVDWHYSTKALNLGGLLVMDDVPVPAVAPLLRHMNVEPNWRFEGIFDERAAAFTLLAEPAPEEWSAQPFNDGYPDYSFASIADRAKLTARYRMASVRRGAAQRYPRLKTAWKRLASIAGRS